MQTLAMTALAVLASSMPMAPESTALVAPTLVATPTSKTTRTVTSQARTGSAASKSTQEVVNSYLEKKVQVMKKVKKKKVQVMKKEKKEKKEKDLHHLRSVNRTSVLSLERTLCRCHCTQKKAVRHCLPRAVRRESS